MTVVEDGCIQNMAEAEYAIALFMWLRISGHQFNEAEGSVRLDK
jgi:hypothetical protein